MLYTAISGCQWHGCLKCFPRDEQELRNGKTAGWQRQKDKEKLDFIRTQVKEVEVVWGCEIDEMLKHDPEMKLAFDGYMDKGPLIIRDAFMGGRTGPKKLFHRVKPGQKISYMDVTSLYPYIK